MRILIVEDDYTSGILLKKYLADYGDCTVATDGEEAIQLFKTAVKEKATFDLVCLDIMLPKVDGQEVLKEIRMIEGAQKLRGSEEAKVIMTTALSDPQNIITSFREQCEGYLTKPIKKVQLLQEMAKLGLIEEDHPT